MQKKKEEKKTIQKTKNMSIPDSTNISRLNPGAVEDLAVPVSYMSPAYYT